jgi:hypothetical protein
MQIWNPVDYVRLLGYYLFDPAQLDRYPAAVTRALAVWLASTLLWLPLAINIAAYGLREVPFWGFTQEPLALLPGWFVVAGWLLTGLLGQIDFEARTGLRAFLRGPLQILMLLAGLALAVLYVGSSFDTPPVLEPRAGLIYVLATQAQLLLIIAGGLSAFVGAILANNLGRGVVSWLGASLSFGFLVLYGLLLYIPLGENLLPPLPPDGPQSDVTSRGLLAFSSVICCAGALLLVTGATVGGALRRRQVGRFNFLLPLMLAAAYGILAWVHVVG